MSDETLTADETRAMIAEYERRGTCTCPRCGRESQPWAGMWACECGAITSRQRLEAAVILAIDPGPEQSAVVLWDGESVRFKAKKPNLEIEGWFKSLDSLVEQMNGCWVDEIVIEMIASYGMPVGAEVFETCVWIGRFIGAAGATYNNPLDAHRITRLQVKNHLCHSSRANDANIRQAIIDRFGGKDAAIGKKATPGPLYGISGDEWAALAVALTWSDQRQFERIGGRG